MSGGGSATEQASIEAGQRVQAKQGQSVADRVRVEPRIALERSRDLSEQLVGVRQGVLNGILRGSGVHWSDDSAHVPLSCGAHKASTGLGLPATPTPTCPWTGPRGCAWPE